MGAVIFLILLIAMLPGIISRELYKRSGNYGMIIMIILFKFWYEYDIVSLEPQCIFKKEN